MSVRRGALRLTAVLVLTAGAMLAGPSALAQDADPCAPAADGSVPEMCQGGMAPEPAPEPDPCTPDAEGNVPEMCQSGGGSDPTDPCPAQPVEPGDGVVTDPGTSEPGGAGTDGAEPGIAVGEPNPNLPPEEPAAEGEVKPEPATEPDAPVSNEAPDVIAEPGIICAFGAPVSAPVADGAPEAAAGGGAVTAVDSSAPEAAAQLPRTGPKERLMALGGLGAVLLVLGGAAMTAARRRAEA